MPNEKKQSLLSIFLNGLLFENPVLGLVLGICSALAVTTSVQDALGMGVAVTFVLVGSNLIISALRKFIPDNVRIPVFVVVICTFVTVVELLIKAFFPALNKALGVFLPLIVVNCIILARAEAFAFKNTIPAALVDGLGAGVGYTAAMFVISAFREIIGSGTFLGISLFGAAYEPMLLFVMAPGAFITLGLMLGLVNLVVARAKQRKSSRGGARA